MKVTYYGQACFLVEFNDKNLLFDPFISHNPLAKDIDIETIPADYILITHGHGDHIADLDSIAQRTGAKIISNYEIATWYGNNGFKDQVIHMNHGGKAKFDFGTAKYVNAIHSSSFPDGSYAGNPGGFVIWGEAGCFYHSGDTALTWDLKLIPMTCPALDFAILPIGDNFTMGYEDAVIASDFIGCDNIIGCHYDTFPPIEIDKNAAKEAFSGKNLILPEIGETISF